MPIHLFHTALSALLLWQGWRQYSSFDEVLDDGSHWTLSGAVILIVAFGYGVWQIGGHWYRFMRR